MEHLPLSDILERLCSLMRAEDRRLGLAHDLQPVQLDALRYLHRCNRYSDTPQAVAEYLGLTKGTVSQSLKALESKGLITKHPDAKDRRVVHLAVTRSGERVIEATETACGPMPQHDPQLNAQLTAFLRDIQRQNGRRSFGLCASCRFHEREGRQRRCGLTGEPLSARDAERICREHEHKGR